MSCSFYKATKTVIRKRMNVILHVKRMKEKIRQQKHLLEFNTYFMVLNTRIVRDGRDLP